MYLSIFGLLLFAATSRSDQVSNVPAQTTASHVYYFGSIPGDPGIDYPLMADTEETGFQCPEDLYGYFADIETDCQMFHVCQKDSRHDKFLCPNGTLFNQQIFTCDWWFHVDCSLSKLFYESNKYLESSREIEQIRRPPNTAYQNGFGNNPEQFEYGTSHQTPKLQPQDTSPNLLPFMPFQMLPMHFKHEIHPLGISGEKQSEIQLEDGAQIGQYYKLKANQPAQIASQKIHNTHRPTVQLEKNIEELQSPKLKAYSARPKQMIKMVIPHFQSNYNPQIQSDVVTEPLPPGFQNSPNKEQAIKTVSISQQNRNGSVEHHPSNALKLVASKSNLLGMRQTIPMRKKAHTTHSVQQESELLNKLDAINTLPKTTEQPLNPTMFKTKTMVTLDSTETHNGGALALAVGNTQEQSSEENVNQAKTISVPSITVEELNSHQDHQHHLSNIPNLLDYEEIPETDRLTLGPTTYLTTTITPNTDGVDRLSTFTLLRLIATGGLDLKTEKTEVASDDALTITSSLPPFQVTISDMSQPSIPDKLHSNISEQIITTTYPSVEETNTFKATHNRSQRKSTKIRFRTTTQSSEELTTEVISDTNHLEETEDKKFFAKGNSHGEEEQHQGNNNKVEVTAEPVEIATATTPTPNIADEMFKVFSNVSSSNSLEVESFTVLSFMNEIEKVQKEMKDESNEETQSTITGALTEFGTEYPEKVESLNKGKTEKATEVQIGGLGIAASTREENEKETKIGVESVTAVTAQIDQLTESFPVLMNIVSNETEMITSLTEEQPEDGEANTEAVTVPTAPTDKRRLKNENDTGDQNDKNSITLQLEKFILENLTAEQNEIKDPELTDDRERKFSTGSVKNSQAADDYVFTTTDSWAGAGITTADLNTDFHNTEVATTEEPGDNVALNRLMSTEINSDATTEMTTIEMSKLAKFLVTKGSNNFSDVHERDESPHSNFQEGSEILREETTLSAFTELSNILNVLTTDKGDIGFKDLINAVEGQFGFDDFGSAIESSNTSLEINSMNEKVEFSTIETNTEVSTLDFELGFQVSKLLGSKNTTLRSENMNSVIQSLGKANDEKLINQSNAEHSTVLSTISELTKEAELLQPITEDYFAAESAENSSTEFTTLATKDSQFNRIRFNEKLQAYRARLSKRKKANESMESSKELLTTDKTIQKQKRNQTKEFFNKKNRKIVTSKDVQEKIDSSIEATVTQRESIDANTETRKYARKKPNISY